MQARSSGRGDQESFAYAVCLSKAVLTESCPGWMFKESTAIFGDSWAGRLGVVGVVTWVPVECVECTHLNLLVMRGCAGRSQAWEGAAQLAAPRHLQVDVVAGRTSA